MIPEGVYATAIPRALGRNSENLSIRVENLVFFFFRMIDTAPWAANYFRLCDHIQTTAKFHFNFYEFEIMAANLRRACLRT